MVISTCTTGGQMEPADSINSAHGTSLDSSRPIKQELPNTCFMGSSTPRGQKPAASMSEVALKIQINKGYNGREQERATTVPEHEPAPVYTPERQSANVPEYSHLDSPLREIHEIWAEGQEGTENILSQAFIGSIPRNSDQPGRKVILKNLIIEYTSLHNLGDKQTLVVMGDDSNDDICLTQISPMRWKAAEIIECYHNSGDLMLVVHSNEWGGEEFLTLTSDEIYAMTCAEEDTPANCIFTPMTDESHIEIMMFFTIGSTFKLREENDVATRQALITLSKAKQLQQGFKETEDIEYLTQIISICPRAISLAPRRLDAIIDVLLILAYSYLLRYSRTGNLQDINHAISYYKKGVYDLTPSGHADLPRWLNSNLGISYMLRFECTGELEDIINSISYHQIATDLTPPGHADHPALLNNLGISYRCRFDCTGELEDIENSISYQRKVVDLTSPGHADHIKFLNNLGFSYMRRFERIGDLGDIDCAISYLQKAVDRTPSGHAGLHSWSNNLGISYRCRFERTGELEDIENSISYQKNAVDLAPLGHAYLPGLLNNLGISYMRRFEHIGNFEDINHAISYCCKAVDLIPAGRANRHHTLMNNLGLSYMFRFQHNGNLEDIECAISFLHKGVDLAPYGNTQIPLWLSNLGNSYMRRFERTGNLQDINYAISYHQKAVDLIPAGHANHHTLINNLGLSYMLRFQHNGNLEDIECALSFIHEGVDLSPSGHAHTPGWFSNLGNSYSSRFRRTGNLQEINYAISYHQKAVDLTPSGHTNLPIHLGHLGASYLTRFDCSGDFEDIDYAISHHRKAVSLTPPGHTKLLLWFGNLGNSYSRRFICTANLQDINYAIYYQQRAVDLLSPDQASLPSLFNNLGCSYRSRFERTTELEDIENSISYHRRSVDHTPAGHANLPEFLGNLGSSYLIRFERNGDLEDIDYSISYHQKAVDLSPSGHFELPIRLNNLGASYYARFRAYNNFLDIQKSIISYRHGVQSSGSPSSRLLCAQNAAIHSAIHEPSQCLVDCALVISLLAEVAGLEQTIHRRFDNLHEHSKFARSVVAVALLLNRPDLALEWLEQSRCLVWNQLRQLRTPIDSLRIQNASLADQFVSAASALESYGSRSRLPISILGTTLADEIRLQTTTHNHTRYAEQYTKILDNIRALPDFNSFLRPPKMRDILSSLPTDGPVVVFNLNQVRCDALALISGMEVPLHIPLVSFSLRKAEDLLKTLRFDILKHREVEDHTRTMPQRVKSTPSSMSHVLKELWLHVVQPVLQALGYYPSLSAHHRIWWCPTGPLAFLPLHAAGIYGPEYTPGFCISDYVVSSYTPTVQSLTAKLPTSSAAAKRSKILLISPNTPSLPQIPLTRMETHDLKELFGEHSLLLEDDEATTDLVKKELINHSWVHFACHGIQNSEDPLRSGLHLYDGCLDLLEIMRLKLSNPDLAFLSACQTSKGDLKLSEEVVHLAAGMLSTGYCGVVGMMWSISDLYGPKFANHFYEYLL